MEDEHSIVHIEPQSALQVAGHEANKIAALYIFHEYREGLARNTRTSHDIDLDRFAEFLMVAQPDLVEKLSTDPQAWKFITWGLVKGFVQWQLQLGYAIGSVNRRLSTVKRYADYAHMAGYIPEEEHTRIQSVHGYGHKQGRNIDEQREATRTGNKKESVTDLADDQAEALKHQPDTLQGRRDALLMCLLIDHGFRVGEVAALNVEDFNLSKRMITFYRRKVDSIQKHKLSADTFYAATAYLFNGGPKTGEVWYCTRKDGRILEYIIRDGKQIRCHFTERAIEDRVEALGKQVGVEDLSPHDLRHYWAFQAVEAGTDIKALQDAGGWNSPAMPLRYVKSTEVANERVKYKKKQSEGE